MHEGERFAEIGESAPVIVRATGPRRPAISSVEEKYRFGFAV